MRDDVACVECGAAVSEITARRMGGLCVSCKMKRSRTDPFHVFYKSLIDRVHRAPDGFDGLSEPERLYFAVMLLRNEVYNGGFRQYFSNSSGSYYTQAEQGLISVGAVRTLALLRKAKGVLFPAAPVPIDAERRQQTIPVADPAGSPPHWVDQLNELDQLFYADSEHLTLRMKEFARRQGLVSDIPA